MFFLSRYVGFFLPALEKKNEQKKRKYLFFVPSGVPIDRNENEVLLDLENKEC